MFSEDDTTRWRTKKSCSRLTVRVRHVLVVCQPQVCSCMTATVQQAGHKPRKCGIEAAPRRLQPLGAAAAAAAVALHTEYQEEGSLKSVRADGALRLMQAA